MITPESIRALRPAIIRKRLQGRDAYRAHVALCWECQEGEKLCALGHRLLVLMLE